MHGTLLGIYCSGLAWRYHRRASDIRRVHSLASVCNSNYSQSRLPDTLPRRKNLRYCSKTPWTILVQPQASAEPCSKGRNAPSTVLIMLARCFSFRPNRPHWRSFITSLTLSASNYHVLVAVTLAKRMQPINGGPKQFHGSSNASHAQLSILRRPSILPAHMNHVILA